jgi:hypothetical protein
MAGPKPTPAQVHDFVAQSGLVNLDAPLSELLDKATALTAGANEMPPIHVLAMTNYVLITDVAPPVTEEP